VNYQINHQIFNQAELLGQAERWQHSDSSWLSDLGGFILNWFDDAETIEVNTSGSTGIPKKILLPKKAMISSAKMTIDYFKLNEKSNALLCLPIKFIAGKMMVVRAFTAHWNLIVREPSSNPLDGLTDKIHFAAFTPMQVESMIRHHANSFSKIDVVIIGGAAISPTLEQQLSAFSNRIFATYGMTETITHIALRKVGKGNDEFDALPHVKFEVDQENCLRIHAPHLTETIQTNDVVDLISPTCFRFLGRRDNIINSGGIKISPELIEESLSHFLDLPFFLWKKVDERLGEKLVMYIEDSHASTDIPELLDRIKASLKSIEIPKEIILVKTFERTATDKIIRKNYDQI
jgi:O-succinylbenzoic acid--CoA ligase